MDEYYFHTASNAYRLLYTTSHLEIELATIAYVFYQPYSFYTLKDTLKKTRKHH